jgi:hypothetical protein
VKVLPSRHVNAAVFSDSNKYVWDCDVGLDRQAAIEEIGVGFPDVLEEGVT